MNSRADWSMDFDHEVWPKCYDFCYALINGTTMGDFISVPIDSPPTLSVIAPTFSSVWVKFLYNGASWRLPMVSGSSYSVKMPTLPSGVVSYRIEAGNDPFDPVSTNLTIAAALPNLSSYYTYTNSETLGFLRKPDLADWKANYVKNTNPYTGLLDGAGTNAWLGVKLSMNYDNTLNLIGYTNAISGANNDPLVRTWTLMTAGTIWFKAKYIGDTNGVLLVEKSTGTPSSTHTTLYTLHVPYSDNWIQYRLDVNSDTPAYYRIRHPSGELYGVKRIIIKDIVISAPAADVVMTKSAIEYNPGYPSRHDPVTFSVSITNVFTRSPATNISPKLIWRRPNGAWNTAPMPFLSNSVYQVTLPAMDPGDFEYYYRTDFTGYAYNGPLYLTVNTVAENASDFSQWLRGTYISEYKSPSYYVAGGDFTNSQLYNISSNPPVCINDGSSYTNTFDYLHFTVSE